MRRLIFLIACLLNSVCQANNAEVTPQGQRLRSNTMAITAANKPLPIKKTHDSMRLEQAQTVPQNNQPSIVFSSVGNKRQSLRLSPPASGGVSQTTLIPAPVEESSFIPNGPTLVKSCDDIVVLFKSGVPANILNTMTSKGQGGECVQAAAQEGMVLGKKTEVLGQLNQGLTFWRTKLESQFKDLSDLDKDMLDSITHYVMSTQPNQITNRSDFYPRIDPDLIKLMFTLSYLTYYNKSDSKNTPNYVSTAYRQELAKLEGEIKSLTAKLQKIKQFEDSLAFTFGADTIKFIEQRRLESQEESDVKRQDSSINTGRYDQSFGMQVGNNAGQNSFGQQHGGGSYGSGQASGRDQGRAGKVQTETNDLHVRNFAPQLVREKARTFNSIFNDVDARIADINSVTLEDIEERLDRIARKTTHALLEAKRSLQILSDPRVGEFWVKVDSTFNRFLEGFKPVDVFYRNMTPYKTPNLLRRMVASKANSQADLGNKEVSGVMLYRGGKGGQPHKIDQLILAFSGSNSVEDWNHNFDGLKNQGQAKHSLAIGFRVHQGIMNSLSESLSYNGTNLKRWFDKYVKENGQGKSNRGERPTLRIAVTGHSLGGALALLMALDIKQNIAPHYQDKINIEVVVYTFGAPPIIDKKFAQKAEDLLGKGNVLRVWNLGDPVSTFSIIKKTEDVFKRSALMTLLGYAHIGTSIPLSDNEGMASLFNKLSPWTNHSSDRYSNLIETNWKGLLNRKAHEIFYYMQSHNLLKGEVLKSTLEDMNTFLRSNKDAVKVLPAPIVNDVIATLSPKTQTAPTQKTMQNHNAITESRFSEGVSQQPKLAKAEVKNLTYTHTFRTGQTVPMKIDRGTSCDVKSIIKQTKINSKAFDANDLNELSCGCCLSKNYFISMDATFASKLRSVFGKKISTVQEVYKHCSKYCSPLTGTVFTDKVRANVDEIGALMDRLGLGDMWQQKKLQ
ncbi:MAG: lipase family protein [Candidatus Paracaedibacteraceae bacterium]|nr:lipase family protein [Candidatus Paracaedibacteraceae bacterium]